MLQLEKLMPIRAAMESHVRKPAAQLGQPAADGALGGLQLQRHLGLGEGPGIGHRGFGSVHTIKALPMLASGTSPAALIAGHM